MRFRTKRAYGQRQRWRRFLDLCVSVGVIAGLAVVAASVQHFSGEEISGRMRVVDGDTLALGGRRLRLIGIDAPELRQYCSRGNSEYPCGLEAAAYLRDLVGSAGGQVECRSEGSDRYRRVLVRCQSDGNDINLAMVRSGHAVAYGDYQLVEADAILRRVGLWTGEFERPADFRAEQDDRESWSFMDLVMEHAGTMWLWLKRTMP